jgi:hypothetical protein
MHYLSSVDLVTIPLHVSGLLVAHHQEVTKYIYNNWYVVYILVDCRRAADSQRKRCIYTLLRPDNGQLASLKHVKV